MKLRHGIGILALSIYGILIIITAFKCWRLYSHIVVEGQLIERIESIRRDPKYLILEEVPDYYIDALIQIEDERFYQHRGLDYLMLLKDMNPLKKWEHISITEQVIRNVYTDEEKGIASRIVCCILAQNLEESYTKQEILELYLNTQKFGKDCIGLAKASERYFHKPPSELSERECRELLARQCCPNDHIKGMERVEKGLENGQSLWKHLEAWLYQVGMRWLKSMSM